MKKKKRNKQLYSLRKKWQLDGYKSECSSWVSLKDELTGDIYFYFCVILHLCIFYNKHMLICAAVMLRNIPNKTKGKMNTIGKNNLCPCPSPFLFSLRSLLGTRSSYLGTGIYIYSPVTANPFSSTSVLTVKPLVACLYRLSDPDNVSLSLARSHVIYLSNSLNLWDEKGWAS